MKIEELKHNHSLTDLLKISLFSILMLAPVAMVATRCGYVMINKNAYESYSQVATNTTTIINDGDTLSDGLMYTFTYSSGTTTTGNTRYDIKNGQTNIVNLYFTNETWTPQYVQFYAEHGNTRLIVYDTNNTSHNKFDWELVSNTFYIVLDGNKTQPTGTQYYNVYQISYTYEKLDNVFEYSINKLEESSLFNWTENTAIFSGINAMNTQLGINSPAITIVLTYWLILTCIYVIIDIVLKLFTYLTHMISSRKS